MYIGGYASHVRVSVRWGPGKLAVYQMIKNASTGRFLLDGREDEGRKRNCANPCVGLTFQSVLFAVARSPSVQLRPSLSVLPGSPSPLRVACAILRPARAVLVVDTCFEPL